MKLSRDFTMVFHFLLDQLIPPLLRDSKWFMWLPFKLLFRGKADIFFKFKQSAPYMNEKEFRQLYIESASVHTQRATDLNRSCLAAIDDHIKGRSVLDIACGRGFLSRHLTHRYRVTAADVVIEPQMIKESPMIHFGEARLEKLPFVDKAFDTVICTHTLEHVRDVKTAIGELRRVTGERLIIVVPKQRPYQYTFDLHLHFFPYAANLLLLLGPGKGKRSCQELGGDWFYVEDATTSSLPYHERN